jgi:Cdc6-like AAA superfamily ATPase
MILLKEAEMPSRPTRIFRWNLNILAKLIIRVLENHWDFILAIEGKRGVGKSTLAYQLCRRLRRVPERKKGTFVFSPNKDILYTQKEVLRAINMRYKSVVFCDEMVATAFNRDFYLENQKKLIKAINMRRDRYNFIILCIPSFAVLDTQIKQLVKMRISVTKRGYAIIQTPIKSIYSKDIWDSVTNEAIEKTWTTKGVNKPKYSRLSTFRGIMKFPDLPPKHRELYEQIKERQRNQIVLDEMEKDEGSEKGITNKALARQLTIALENGIIKTRNEFDKMCLALGNKPSIMTQEVRTYNRDRGIDIKIKDYFDRWNLDGTEAYKPEEKKKQQTISPNNVIPLVLRED